MEQQGTHIDASIKIRKETIYKVGFISFIVPEFAKSYKMSMPDSYKYLKKYGAWDYLNENWWALHTDNPFWTVRYLYDMCYKNGGLR
jgi:acid phosphatase class B